MFPLSRPFPSEESVEDEDIYNHLEDLIEYVNTAKTFLTLFGALIRSFSTVNRQQMVVGVRNICSWVLTQRQPSSLLSTLRHELPTHPFGSITSQIGFRFSLH